MHYTTLGKTGLKVSVAGLGCGGNSRIGLGTGLTEAQSVALVREALDLGVNFLDTAAAYETEGVVGKAIKGRPRDSVVISTKSHATSGPAVLANLDNSLRQLDTDYVDIFHLHGLGPAAYDKAMAEIVPGLLRAKEQGKLRHLAVSETGPRDPEHTMLARAVEEGIWEVFMLGFSMMHQNAKNRLLPRTREKGIGTLCMFAVRNIFSKPDVLKKTFAELAAEGKVPAAMAAADNPLGLSRARGRGRERGRCRLPLRPPHARHRCRPVRHRQRRPPARQHRLHLAPAAPRRRRGQAPRPLRQPRRRRPRPPGSHEGRAEALAPWLARRWQQRHPSSRLHWAPSLCYVCPMAKKRSKPHKRTGLGTRRSRATLDTTWRDRSPAEMRAIIQKYIDAVAATASPAEKDDLVHVKLLPPAVKPKGVKPQEIRKAVLRAVETYGERHAKATARS